MFFVLSKIFHFLVAPFVWFLIFLILFLVSKKQKRKKFFLTVSVIIIFLFSNSFIFDEAIRLWEIPATPYEELDSSYQAGIVLCGMMSWDADLERINFHGSVDRLLQALELYKRGYLKKILLTGGSGSLLTQYEKESIFLKNYLVEIGIPGEDIIIETSSRNTRENAIYTARVLEEKNINTDNCLLITSASHMRRALGCFEKAGISTDTYSTNRIAGPRKFDPNHLIIPHAYTLAGWSGLFHEIFGYAVYRVMGYI